MCKLVNYKYCAEQTLSWSIYCLEGVRQNKGELTALDKDIIYEVKTAVLCLKIFA